MVVRPYDLTLGFLLGLAIVAFLDVLMVVFLIK